MHVDQAMTIYTAAALKPSLLAAIDARDFTLDLTDVAELDSAGVQLILLMKREARELGTTLRLTGATPPVLEILRLLDIRGVEAPAPAAADAQPQGAHA